MVNKLRRPGLLAATTIFTAMAIAQPALAQDVGQVATNITGTMNNVANLLVAAAGLGGIFMFITGARDLVTATVSGQGGRGDVKHSHAGIKMVASALLISLAIGINVFKTTLFESTSNSTITPNTISVTGTGS
jgi:hypothetical protein